MPRRPILALRLCGRPGDRGVHGPERSAAAAAPRRAPARARRRQYGYGDPASAPASAAASGACSATTDAGTVKAGMDIARSARTIEAKVGDVIEFTNSDNVAHTATLDDGSCTTANLGKGTSGALTFSAAGTYPFHCKIHPDMTGTFDDHELTDRDRRAGAGRCGAQAGRSARNAIAPDGRSIAVGVGQPGLREPRGVLLAGDERRALVQLVELDPGDQLAMAGPELVGPVRERPVEHEHPAARSKRTPRRPQDRRRVVELVEGVLEVGEVERARLAGL